MADAIYTVVLDVTDNGCIDTGWRLHQGDYGESQVVVKVVNNGVNMFDENVRPQITFRRSDGISIVGAMFIEDSTYKYNFYGNELAVPGIVLMDLKFIDSQGRTSTAASRFIVLPNPEGDTQEGSHTYINSGLVSELRENVQIAVESAAASAEDALASEGWAVGEQNGVPVSQDSPYYNNNSKWWSEQANPTMFGSLSDVSFGTLNDDEIAVFDFDSGEWINEVGVSTDVKSVRIVQGLAQFKTRTGGLLQSAVVSLEPVQSGSGTPSPSNVRPISGHNSITFDNKPINLCPTFRNITGKQLKWYAVVNDGIVTFRVTQDLGWVPANDLNIARSAPVEVQSGVEYELSGLTSGGEYKWWIEIRNESGSRLDTELGSYKVYNSKVTFTPTTTHKITIACMVGAGVNAYSHSITFAPMLINADEWYAEQSVAPRFVPYQPIEQQTVVELGQTVYGGSLNIVSGVLTVDRRYLLADGDNVKCTGGYGGGTERLPGINISSAKGMSNNNLIGSYLVYNANAELENNRNTMLLFSNGEYIALHINDIRGVGSGTPYADNSELYAAANTYLQSNNLQICYELATPLTIQLTPQQIETLIGQNNISVPLTGQSLDSLTYREMMAWDDVEKAIEPKADISAIGTDESGRTTASRQYTRGERFYKDGKYCRTKTAVAQGATWTLNTNYEETSIASEQRVQEESASVPSAMSSYVTINRQTIVRCGLVVSVAMQITVNSMPSNGGVILNMPFTNQGTAKFFGIYGGSSFSPTGTGVYISSDSYEVRCASAIPNGQHWISGTYIMKTY